MLTGSGPCTVAEPCELQGGSEWAAGGRTHAGTPAHRGTTHKEQATMPPCPQILLSFKSAASSPFHIQKVLSEKYLLLEK